jgi:hypothetical protein
MRVRGATLERSSGQDEGVDPLPVDLEYVATWLLRMGFFAETLPCRSQEGITSVELQG